MKILLLYLVIGIFTTIRYQFMIKNVTKDYTNDNKHRPGAFSKRTTFWMSNIIVGIVWPYWLYKRMKSNLKYWNNDNTND